jgi:hypothetical protein
MSATVQITRHTSFAVELVRHPFEILVDDKVVGEISMRETVDLTVGIGPHIISLRAGRRTSPKRSFDSTEGEVIRFSCYGARLWPIYVASLAVGRLGISLKRE